MLSDESTYMVFQTRQCYRDGKQISVLPVAGCDGRDAFKEGSTRKVLEMRKLLYNFDGSDGYMTIGIYQNR